MKEKEENNQSGWGGKRDNAGRKKKDHGKYYGFNSTREVESILQSLESSKTEFINDAILFYAHAKGFVRS